MEDNLLETAQDMIRFLESTSQMERFIDWCVERGNDEDTLRNDMIVIESL